MFKRPFSIFLTVLVLLLFHLNEPLLAEEDSSESLRVAIVGDTGIGERAFHPGFLAVQKSMREFDVDAILHLGDFVYQPEWFPDKCDQKYIDEIRETLVIPYKNRIFVAGDNDLPPKKSKPKASGCWGKISTMRTPFDPYIENDLNVQPRSLEGSISLGNVLFVVLNSYDWKDPSPWLKPLIDNARMNNQWVVFALHEPAVTTAWFIDKRHTVLKHINSLKPDLVFSGNQHSYERFFPMGIPDENGGLQQLHPNTTSYLKGEGSIHIVTGGGGATFKPFADLQGYEKRTAPKPVFDALAKRALMNHFLILDVHQDKINIKTYRVCPTSEEVKASNPRWKPDKPMWNDITLECGGKKPGTSLYEEFEIVENK
ncbi:MAG: metallophosphoesterase [Nitrospinales bacterium]